MVPNADVKITCDAWFWSDGRTVPEFLIYDGDVHHRGKTLEAALNAMVTRYTEKEVVKNMSPAFEEVERLSTPALVEQAEKQKVEGE